MEETAIVRKTRLLTQLLLLSITLNVGLLATFFYRSLTPEPVATEVSPKNHFEVTNGEMIYSYFHCTFNELVDKLSDERLVEEGYRVCDLALACLVSYHHFDLERALPSARIQRRHLLFVHVDGGEQVDIPVFPGLTEEDFSAVAQFAQREKHPLTPKGLFLALSESNEKSLQEAFFRTSPFVAVQTLFNREGMELSQPELLALLREGNWSIIRKIHEEKVFTKEQQLAVLSSLVGEGSEKAARLLLTIDKEYALKRLPDETLAKLVKHTDDKEVLKTVAHGVRQDKVRAVAQEKLGEPQVNREGPETYVIKKGDTLWHIAKKFHVTVKDLQKANTITNLDKIKPGKEITIP